MRPSGDGRDVVLCRENILVTIPKVNNGERLKKTKRSRRFIYWPAAHLSIRLRKKKEGKSSFRGFYRSRIALIVSDCRWVVWQKASYQRRPVLNLAKACVSDVLAVLLVVVREDLKIAER